MGTEFTPLPRHKRLYVRSHDANVALGDIDVLRERAQRVTTIAAFQPDTIAGRCGKPAQHLRRYRLLSCVLEYGLRPVGTALA